MGAKALPSALRDRRSGGRGTVGSLLAQLATNLGSISHSNAPAPISKLVSLPPAFLQPVSHSQGSEVL